MDAAEGGSGDAGCVFACRSEIVDVAAALRDVGGCGSDSDSDSDSDSSWCVAECRL